jgi:hypothetical protein
MMSVHAGLSTAELCEEGRVGLPNAVAQFGPPARKGFPRGFRRALCHARNPSFNGRAVAFCDESRVAAGS